MALLEEAETMSFYNLRKMLMDRQLVEKVLF